MNGEVWDPTANKGWGAWVTPPAREYLVEVLGNGWGHTMIATDEEVHAACRLLAMQHPDRWVRARRLAGINQPTPPLYDADGQPLGIVCLLEPSVTLPREDGDAVEPAPDQDALFG